MLVLQCSLFISVSSRLQLLQPARICKECWFPRSYHHNIKQISPVSTNNVTHALIPAIFKHTTSAAVLFQSTLAIKTELSYTNENLLLVTTNSFFPAALRQFNKVTIASSRLMYLSKNQSTNNYKQINNNKTKIKYRNRNQTSRQTNRQRDR